MTSVGRLINATCDRLGLPGDQKIAPTGASMGSLLARYQRAVEERGVRAFVEQLAGQYLIERGRMKHRRAWPEQNQDAGETGDRCNPSSERRPFSEQGSRQQHDEDRRQKGDRRGFRKRQIAQRGKKAKGRDHQHRRADELQ
jgi:hypothetical protein